VDWHHCWNIYRRLTDAAPDKAHKRQETRNGANRYAGRLDCWVISLDLLWDPKGRLAFDNHKLLFILTESNYDHLSADIQKQQTTLWKTITGLKFQNPNSRPPGSMIVFLKKSRGHQVGQQP